MKKLYILFIALIVAFTLQAQTLLDTALDFTVTTTAGQQITLFDMLDQDVIVLIDFFSTTCSGCNTYAPEFQKAYENFGCNTSNVFFIGIDKWNSHDDVVAFDDLHGIEYPSVAGADGGYGVFLDWLVASTPSLVIVDPDRSIKVAQIWPPDEATITNNLETYGGIQKECNLGVFINPFNELDITVSPNPATSFVQLSFNSPESGKYTASITNIVGAVVKETIYQQSYSGETYFDIDLSGLPEGMYILFLSRNKQLISSQKLIIVN